MVREQLGSEQQARFEDEDGVAASRRGLRARGGTRDGRRAADRLRTGMPASRALCSTGADGGIADGGIADGGIAAPTGATAAARAGARRPG